MYDTLESWKEQDKKKALCIIGARQIGKTTIVREFAKNNYKKFIELNFLSDESLSEIFSNDLNADSIITKITAYTRMALEPGNTLILLDEIQECPNARTAIKFLVEDGRFDYIETGSMLGVRYKEVKSYPVGFEEVVYMYPMNFYEFAVANGVQTSTFDILEDCYKNNKEVDNIIDGYMKKLFYLFCVVGGMPEVVQTYIDTKDIGKVINLQLQISELYRLDMSKYAVGNDKTKIKEIYDSIPSQLNNKNRRFFLSKIDKNGRQNRYENSFNWLADAGIAIPVYNVCEPQAPLALNEKRNLFKLFMGDTGLLSAKSLDSIQFNLLQGDVSINNGSILENLFAQELKTNGFILYYYDSKKHGELDFVVQNNSGVDLIEVKSGNDYKNHNALDNVSEVDEWLFNKKVIFCKGNVEVDGEYLYLPWYMIMFYKRKKVQEMIYDISDNLYSP